nr:polyribonucleotide nucleotidyltransferase [uncultured Mogibacterium sp.]
MGNKTINKSNVYGKYEDKLLDLMAQGNADFTQADNLIALGADINAIGDNDDENILSNIILEYRMNHRKNVGKKLYQIVEYFLSKGFDVNKNDGKYGAACLKSLIFATYDSYTIDLAKLLFDAGARIIHYDDDCGYDTLQDWFSTESSFQRVCCDDEHLSNIFESVYQVFEAQKIGRDYQGIDWYGKSVEQHICKVYVEDSFFHNFKCDIYYDKKKNSLQFSDTIYMILDEGVRPDNRKLNEIRPLFNETGFLPRAHGTGLFKRGQTQVLSIATLAPLSEAQDLDSIDIDRTTKRYMHQYNFPGYSTGEPKPPRSPGRREIGHGALAERALLPVIPSEEEFPYAIRVVSEVLSSNGSSSMGSTCGSCLALMDAGVPIKKPVSGIAMGLIERVEEDGSSRYAILSDIQGMEDFLGDMDFKVTGTPDGITAIQMDIKVHGLSREILEQALEQAREGRAHILDSMLEEISEPRAELSPYAPRCISMRVHPDKVRLVIGPGGKNVNKIVEETGCKVDISDDDVGLISIYSSDEASAAKAKSMIEYLTADVEVGKTYEGEVKRIMNFGAFIEILPGKEGLLHISKIANHRVDKVEDVMNIGDKVVVKVTEIDNQNRINLSRKELVED